MLAFLFPLIILCIFAYKEFGFVGVFLVFAFVIIVAVATVIHQKKEEEELDKLLSECNPNYKPRRKRASGVNIDNLTVDANHGKETPKEKGYTIDEMVEMDMMLDDDW